MHCKETEHKNQLSIKTKFFIIQTQTSKLYRIRARCLHGSDTFSFELQPKYTLEKARQNISMDCLRVSFKKATILSILISKGTLYLEVTGNKLNVTCKVKCNMHDMLTCSPFKNLVGLKTAFKKC